MLTLGCALGFAFHCLALSHVSPRIGFQPLALLQVGFCAIFMALSLPLIEHPQITWTSRLTVALGVAAVFATARCFFHSELGAVGAAPHPYRAPADAGASLCLDYLVPVMGERLGFRPACGALLILASIALMELAPQPHLPRRMKRENR